MKKENLIKIGIVAAIIIVAVILFVTVFNSLGWWASLVTTLSFIIGGVAGYFVHKFLNKKKQVDILK